MAKLRRRCCGCAGVRVLTKLVCASSCACGVPSSGRAPALEFARQLLEVVRQRVLRLPAAAPVRRLLVASCALVGPALLASASPLTGAHGRLAPPQLLQRRQRLRGPPAVCPLCLSGGQHAAEPAQTSSRSGEPACGALPAPSNRCCCSCRVMLSADASSCRCVSSATAKPLCCCKPCRIAWRKGRQRAG